MSSGCPIPSMDACKYFQTANVQNYSSNSLIYKQI